MEHVTEHQMTRRQSTVWRALRAAAPQTIPVLAGYFVLGMGYGIYVQSLGLPVWMPMLMGTVVYGGSLEFVLASLLLSAFSPLSAFLMALMIQARHLFYGLAMLERYKGYGLRSFYMIFAMSDETFSITCSAAPPDRRKGWPGAGSCSSSPCWTRSTGSPARVSARWWARSCPSAPRVWTL